MGRNCCSDPFSYRLIESSEDALILEVKGQGVRAFYGMGDSLRVQKIDLLSCVHSFAAQTIPFLGFTVVGFNAKKWFMYI